MAAAAHHGRLDGVINAAGVVAFGALTDIDERHRRRSGSRRLLGAAAPAACALPVLEPGGVILGISAVVAERPMPNMAAYSATKAATAALFAAARSRPDGARFGWSTCDRHTPRRALADRAIAGDPPRLPAGLDPDGVAARIVEALLGDETEVASSAFG